MNWILVSKKETIARKPYSCNDCEKEWPAGAYVKRFTFKNQDKYLTKKICEKCEKYYRREDLKHEEGNSNNIS